MSEPCAALNSSPHPTVQRIERNLCAGIARKLFAKVLGALDPNEIGNIVYVCNGEAGANGTSGADGKNGKLGADGTDGTNGADGTDGTDGTDGLTSLVTTTVEPSGENCTNGGQRVETGVDDDGNGTLDAGEIDSTKYVCDGVAGLNSLISVVDEPAGANCFSGGHRVEWGQDLDATGILDPGEVEGTEYVCDGASAGDIVYMADGSTRPVTFALCGTGEASQCTADVARNSCQGLGLRVASYISDDTTTVASLGGTACGFNTLYFVSTKSMPDTTCLVGMSALDFSNGGAGCCPISSEWRGNTVAFGAPGVEFGFVGAGNAGYNAGFANGDGTHWDCRAETVAASVPGGCSTLYVACMQ